jgi:hypothetical protein
MKPYLTIVLILATSLVAQARLIRNWSDQELFDQSDLVVIATPTTSADTKERVDLPGFPAQPVIGVETAFAVSAVVKGDKELKNVILHHYRANEERSGPVANEPILIAFKPEEKRKFLLFLKREADGRYAPTVGQVDPGFQGIAALGDPVAATKNSPPLLRVAKATSLDEEEAEALPNAEHAEWVAGCLKDFESIKVGMTRGEIEEKLPKDGGLQSVSPFRFTHPACASFKIDVEFDFKRNPEDHNRAAWNKEDKAVKVSKPYIEWPFNN